MNYRVLKKNQEVFAFGTYNPLIESIPRTPDKLPDKDPDEKEQWKFRKSVFKAYKSDTPKLMKRCFEEDWKNCQTSLPKLIKNPVEL